MTDSLTSATARGDVLRAVADMPASEADPELLPTAQVTRLPSLTNRTYRVTLTGGTDLIVRLPGIGTSTYIDRAAEAHNARLAATLGVGPNVAAFDTKTGIMITRAVPGSTIMSPETLRCSDALARVAASLRRLHRSGVTFHGQMDLAGEISRYRDLAIRLGVTFSPAAERTLGYVESIDLAFRASPVPRTPCHNDPSPANLLDTGHRVVLVDWEFAGMNDPTWDLACLALEGALDRQAENVLLSLYHGQSPHPSALARFDLTKMGLNILAGLWALVQLAHGNPATDFRLFADERFAKATSAAGGGELERLLAAATNRRDR